MQVRQDIGTPPQVPASDPLNQTVGEAAAWMAYTANCKRCRRWELIDLQAMAKLVGRDTRLVGIRERLRCKECGDRGPIISTTTKEYFELHTRHALEEEKAARSRTASQKTFRAE